jgi:hypothetical protein
VPKKECKIDVKVGWVTGRIVDEQGNASPQKRFRSYFALADNIPLIVGFKDLLEKYRIEINASTNEAFIETK